MLGPIQLWFQKGLLHPKVKSQKHFLPLILLHSDMSSAIKKKDGVITKYLVCCLRVTNQNFGLTHFSYF